MSDNSRFYITALSFALVLAVVISLLTWVILPALEEEEKNSEEKKVLSDYIEDINNVNLTAYRYDQEQQKHIDLNAKEIQRLKEQMSSRPALAKQNAATDAVLREILARASTNTSGVSKANQADVTFSKGTWNIKQGGITFKTKPTEMCVNGVCSPWKAP